MAIWTVPIFSQRTAALCWEACARSMWKWRYKSLRGYSKKAGNYLNRNTGLFELQMDIFYRQLGLRSLQNPKGANIQHALKWTPVIFTLIGQATGHAVVTSGYNAGKYTLINPCLSQVVNFDGSPDSCTGGTVQLDAATVEGTLGGYIWYW